MHAIGPLLRKTLRRLWRDEKGVTGLEYGLIGFGISIAIMATVFAIGGEMKNMFDSAGSQLAGRLTDVSPSSD